MPGEIDDLTLPAHDPTFPKPRGLLPVPPEVQEDVVREEERILQEHGFHVAPEAKRQMTDDRTLHYYYEGHQVAFRRTPAGVEVLAAGWDEVRQFFQSTPPEQRQGVLIQQI